VNHSPPIAGPDGRAKPLCDAIAIIPEPHTASGFPHSEC
jgi:hypothetical protein